MATGSATRIGGISFGVSMDTRKLRRNIKSARYAMGGFVRSITGAGALGLAGAAAAGGVALRKLGMAHEELNKSMNRSLAIMGDVSDMMRDEMRQAAIDVSATVNATASQVADGFFYLASAGLDAEQSLAALPKVAKFAQAGNFDLALATDLLTDAQSALGLSVSDTSQNIENLTKVSDVLVKANTLANATVQQFSESLTNKAGAGLRLVNKDIEEGVALLSVYADQGIKGAEAGTALGIVLRDLQTKAINFNSQFRKVNVSVFDANGKMRNLADIVGDLEMALIGMSDKMKKTTLLDLGFSDKSVAFIQALLGTSDAIREYEKNLRNAGGITSEVANKNMTDLEKAMNKLSAAWMQMSENMAPVVSKLADMAENIAEIAKGAQLTDGLFGVNDVGPTQTSKGPKFARYQNAFTAQDLASWRINDAKAAAKGVLDFLTSGKAAAGLRNGIAAGRQHTKDQYEFAGIGRAFTLGKRAFSDAKTNLSAGVGKLMFEYLKLQGKAHTFAFRNNTLGKGNTQLANTEASLSKAGSAEAFRQRRAIELANRKPPKLDVQRNKILMKIEKKLEVPGEVLAAANF